MTAKDLLHLVRKPTALGLSALLLGWVLACTPKPESPPNLLLIVVDTTRADHLGAYGYERDTSPSLDAVASAGTLFENASSTAAYTRPSTASILTGHYPSVHGAITHADMLSDRVQTLAQRLQAGGYRTAGVYRNGNVGAKFGFDRGFDSYISPDKAFWRQRRQDPRQGKEGQICSLVNDRLLRAEAHRLLESFEADRRAGETRPFFLYLHLADPHDPYTPPRDDRSFLTSPLSPTLEKFYSQYMAMKREEASVLRQLTNGALPWEDSTLEQIIALYDAEIAFSDDQIGQILDHLERLDLAENTLVVITSDHGEELFERGDSGHGRNHYEEQLHVPLIARGPGVKAQRITQPVGLIDVTPTLLDFAGLDASDLPGRSLRHALDGRELERRPLFAEGLLNIQARSDPVFYRSIRDGDQKLILDFLHHRKLLFDLDSDPEETQERLSADLDASRELYTQLLERHETNLASPLLQAASTAMIGEEEDAELRALGYVGSSKDSALTDSLFRRPLKMVDIASYGFMGSESEGARYLSSVDFGAGQWQPEQLLYGWRVDRPRILMRRHAGLRLKRENEERWSLSGRILDSRIGLSDKIVLSLTIDGEPGPRREFSAGETIELSGALSPRHRGFARLDFSCRPARPVQANPQGWCLEPWLVALQ